MVQLLLTHLPYCMHWMAITHVPLSTNSDQIKEIEGTYSESVVASSLELVTLEPSKTL